MPINPLVSLSHLARTWGVLLTLGFAGCLDPSVGTTALPDVTADVAGSDAKADGAGDTATTPDLPLLDVFELDVPVDSVPLPDVAGPDVPLPDIAGPDVSLPDIVLPDTTESDTTEPDTTEPDTTEPDTTEPDTTEPDTTEPGDLMEGLWLVGWSGALDHYDWLRFEPLDASGTGTLRWGPPESMGALISLSNCKGVGSWQYVESMVVAVTRPADCWGLDPNNPDDTEYITVAIYDFQTWFNEAVLLHASIQLGVEGGNSLDGHKFPSAWCTPDLSSCDSPYPDFN